MKSRHPVLRWLLRIAWWLFPVVLLVLLVRAARAIDWNGVLAAIAGLDAATLAGAAALTMASYVAYACYDLAARRYAHHVLPVSRTLLIAGIAYALALNVGALIGGTGARFRLYSHAGLGLPTITRVVAFSTSTNWLGYLLLAGALFASGGVVLPERFAAAARMLPWAGWAMLATAAAYLVACHRLHGRMFHVRGHHFRFPSPPLALAQFGLAALNWSLMAAILYVLLPAAVDYPIVLGALLVSAVATAGAHIPGGIGVLEAVFVAVLAGRVPATTVLAALLVYRALYYLLPLVVALLGYVVLETRGKRPASMPG